MLARVMSLRDTLLGDETRRKLGLWWRGENVHSMQPRDGEPRQDAVPVDVACTLLHRIVVGEHLWGRGNLGPGESDFIRELGVGLALTKEKSIAYMGIGLAGAARAIVADSGVWITGYDANAIVSKLAVEQNTMAGMAKKITVATDDFATLAIPPNKYDDIIATEGFSKVEDKARLFGQVAHALRPSGTLLFTEYVAVGEPMTDEERHALFCQDFGEPFPVPSSEYRTLVETNGLDLHIDEDVTGRYAGYATAGWSNLRRILDRLTEDCDEAGERTAIIRAVADAAALWANRIEAFRTGRLAVHRFLATQKPGAL